MIKESLEKTVAAKFGCEMGQKGIVMFVVYSPEGQNKISSTHSLPELKMTKSQHALAEGKSEMDDFRLDEEYLKRSSGSPAALQQYETVQHDHEKKRVVKVHEIMSHPVESIQEDVSLQDAWQLMHQHKVRHLPVKNTLGELVGLISSHTVLARVILAEDGALEEVRNETVADIMQDEVVTTKLDMDIRKVAYVMGFYHIDCLPIMSDTAELIGIVTTSDIVKRVAEEPPLELYA